MLLRFTTVIVALITAVLTILIIVSIVSLAVRACRTKTLDRRRSKELDDDAVRPGDLVYRSGRIPRMRIRSLIFSHCAVATGPYTVANWGAKMFREERLASKDQRFVEVRLADFLQGEKRFMVVRPPPEVCRSPDETVALVRRWLAGDWSESPSGGRFGLLTAGTANCEDHSLFAKLKPEHYEGSLQMLRFRLAIKAVLHFGIGFGDVARVTKYPYTVHDTQKWLSRQGDAPPIPGGIAAKRNAIVANVSAEPREASATSKAHVVDNASTR